MDGRIFPELTFAVAEKELEQTMLLAVQENLLWYILPLAICISLVYSASRYEATESIMRRAVRLFFQIAIFMMSVFGVFWYLSIGL